MATRYTPQIEFAKEIGVHPSTTSRDCREGMPHLKIRSKVMIDHDAAIQWLHDRTVAENQAREEREKERNRKRLSRERDKIERGIEPVKHAELLLPITSKGGTPTAEQIETARVQACAYARKMADAWVELHASGKITVEERLLACRIERCTATREDLAHPVVAAVLNPAAVQEYKKSETPKAEAVTPDLSPSDSGPDIRERFRAMSAEIRSRYQDGEQQSGKAEVTKPAQPVEMTKRERKLQLRAEIQKVERRRPRSLEDSQQLQSLHSQLRSLSDSIPQQFPNA